jgi:hypothetical protein
MNHQELADSYMDGIRDEYRCKPGDERKGRERLRKRVLAFLREHYPDDVLDEEAYDVLEEFDAHDRFHRYPWAFNAPDDGKSERHYFPSPQRGSLDTIRAFKFGMRAAVALREQLTGQREPLTHDEAAAWLREHAGDNDPLAVEDLSLTFEVPRDARHLFSDLLLLCKDNLEDSDVQPLEQLVEMVRSGQVRMVGGISGAVIGYVRIDRESTIALSTGPLLTLARGCQRLNLSSGAASLEDMCDGLESAVWFVLCGTWSRRGVQVSWSRHVTMTMKVYESEIQPEEIRSAYSQHRRLIRGIKGAPEVHRGRPPTRKAEALALVAAEAREIEGRADSETILARWKHRASSLGCDAEDYKTRGAVMKALRRLEQRAARYAGDVRGSSLSLCD